MSPCGTRAKYVWHLNHDEEPCDDCREANRLYSWMRRRREGKRTRGKPRCGTVSGWQTHRRLGEKPCNPCRLAKNEDNRARTRGVSLSKRHDIAKLPELILDVLETFGEPMTAQQIIDHVLRIRPAAQEASVHRALFRLNLERMERLGETLYRI